jgi:hypothetical protein
MNEAALIIPCAALATFTAATRTELLEFAGLATGSGSTDGTPDADVSGPSPAREESPPEMTVAMARKLIAAPISPKSLAILRTVAESETPQFHLADAVRAAPGAATYLDIRGAWSGITRRARKILGDSDADLIWWESDATYDTAGNYVDHVGRVSSLTHQSLRSVFGIRSSN